MLASEGAAYMRAWVDYYHDLGVHDFYRRGEPVPRQAIEAVADSPANAMVRAPSQAMSGAPGWRCRA